MQMAGDKSVTTQDPALAVVAVKQPAATGSGSKPDAGNPAPDGASDGPIMGPLGTWLLGGFHILWAVSLVYLTIVLWPRTVKPGEVATVDFGRGVLLHLPVEVEMILFAMVTGAAGSFIHGATSFATYVGNGTL